MSLPEPRANPSLVGHHAAEMAMAEALRSGRMHHAWLITGPAGIGKATLAFRFARCLLAGGTAGPSLGLDPKNPTFRRVAAGSHADLLTVEREWDPKRRRLRGEIVVDDVRRIAGLLRRTAAEGGWRVVVLDGAEDLNRNAANALLKLLEEPPERAVLLLVCSATGRLLPTIRSRCRRLRLLPLADSEVAEVLAQALPDLDGEQRARLAAIAEGSPGRALQLAEGGGVAAADLVQRTLEAAPGLGAEGILKQAHAIADTLGRDEDAFSTFMDLLRAAIAAAVRDAARGHADPEQMRLLAGRPLAAWIDVWHALTRLQDDTEFLHLDRRHVVVSGLGLLPVQP